MTECEKTTIDLTPHLIRPEQINITHDILRLAGERVAALNERTCEQAVIHSQAQRIEELEKALSEALHAPGEAGYHREDADRLKLRLETLRQLYPNAPSDAELDAAIDYAMEQQK